jgi:hypothetical protein
MPRVHFTASINAFSASSDGQQQWSTACGNSVSANDLLASAEVGIFNRAVRWCIPFGDADKPICAGWH